jgi:hypothetical protein
VWLDKRRRRVIYRSMPSRRALLAVVLGACAPHVRPPAGPPLAPEHALTVAAESWHTDLCLPTRSLIGTPLAPVTAGVVAAPAFAFGFGLESWMRADRPGLAEAFEALGSGPAVVSVRALRGAVPPGAEEEVPLRLPAGGIAAIAAFIAGQIVGPLPPAPPPGAGMLLLPSSIPYSLRFTCNTWVMRALAEGGLPVPVDGIILRRQAMAALRAEAARQAAGTDPTGQGTADRAERAMVRP